MSDGLTAWSRLHPLTPVLRGSRYLLAVVAVVGQQGLRDASLEAALVAAGLGVPVAALAGWLAWRTTRYRVEGAELHVASGVLRKRDRRVPLARVQTVDVVRPLVARVLGLAELRLEVVGGGDSEARLAYLTDDAAVRLRRRLLDLAGGAEEGAAEPAEQVLVEVPTGALVGSVVLGPPLVVAGLLLVASVVAVVVDPRLLGGVVLASVPLLLAVGSLSVRRLLSDYGFSVSEAPAGALRLRHGLLERRTQTIPAGRVQTVRVSEPLLWRRRDWVRVEVDVAGYSGGRGEEQALTTALLPVAPRALADALVARVLGAAPPAASAAAPGAVRWRAPLSGPRLRVGSDRVHVAARHGVVSRTTDVVPLAKAQSLRLTQGPWQRRLGLASVHVDSAGRRLRGAALVHRGEAEAGELLEVLTGRARAARQAQGARDG